MMRCMRNPATSEPVNTMNSYLVLALYKFVPLDDIQALQPRLLQVCMDADVRGTLLLAREGINGTIAGPEQGVRAVLDWLRRDSRFADIDSKESWADAAPFLRLKVRLKKEIVSMGVPDIDPVNRVGTYVDPADWNALISDPDVVVVDTRNVYETGIGTFANAIDPHTTSFREFPQWADDSGLRNSGKKVAMFCTGGIRCEKASAYMRELGVRDVFHLKGGILKYLETVPPQDSLWHGECFVFDERVSVGHGLQPGPYELCHACRHPISAADKQSEYFVAGISCPKCHASQTEDRKQRFAERQKQMELARQRGDVHLGQQRLPGPTTGK